MKYINKDEQFNYDYSSNEQQEILNIVKKYKPQSEDNLSKLKRMDEEVTRKGTIYSLVTGIISTLIMGLGMSMVTVGTSGMFVPGIIIGIIGMAGVGVSYPIYVKVTRKEREKIAPEILRIAEELVK